MVAVAASAAASKIDVGAIRWDAWFGSPPGLAGIVGQTVTGDLSPERYHYRLPFFAKEHAFDPSTNSTVTVNGNTAEVMSAEIQCVADAATPPCVRVCVYACMRVCVCACVRGGGGGGQR